MEASINPKTMRKVCGVIKEYVTLVEIAPQTICVHENL